MVEDQIFVGATAKLVHSSIPDVSSSGVAFDAGVQYWAPNSNFKMGVALRNVGPQVQPGGDGLTVRTQLSGPGSGFDNAVSLKSAAYEMPSVLMIGASYDLKFGGSDSTDHLHRITPTAAFRYRSFHPDQYGAGIEYAFRNYLILRVSHFFEQDIYSDQSRNAFTGLAAGVTLQLPFGENDNIIGVDYSYRPTRYFSGTHTFGLHLNL
jgi:hypothetical protein